MGILSFSSEVKKELCRAPLQRKCCALAESCGVLLYAGTFTSGEVRIVTENAEFAQRLPKLFQKAFSVTFDALPEENGGGKRIFRIETPDKLARIWQALGYDMGQHFALHVNFALLEEEHCRAAYLRGAFLAGGSVTDPEKRYHLELATPHHSVSREMFSVLLDLGFSPKESERGGNALLYFKKADAIADFFTCIGAPVTAMGVMTAKVDKEMRNTVTRQINCDSANTDKTVAAAQAQLAAIRRIAKEYGSLDVLPEPLKDAALLRITNPEASLADLALLSYPPVTKSCMNHRLRKLMEYSASLGKA